MKRTLLQRKSCALAGLLLAIAASGCIDPDTTIDITFSPCDSIALRATNGTARQLNSIGAAVDMWNEIGTDTVLLLSDEVGSPSPEWEIPVRFEEAAPQFFGIYLDESGDIVINDGLRDSDERSVVIAHELGHAFGLEHVSGRKSVMNEENLAYHPDQGDAQSLMRAWPECELLAP
jgi:hypothetical protein